VVDVSRSQRELCGAEHRPLRPLRFCALTYLRALKLSEHGQHPQHCPASGRRCDGLAGWS
jgi:hypothetical protein